MKKLITFGDSFATGESKESLQLGINFSEWEKSTYHCRLVDNRNLNKKNSFSKHISNELDLVDINLSVGGRNNKGIYKDMLNYHYLINDDDFVIICLSSPFRGYTDVDHKVLIDQYKNKEKEKWKTFSNKLVIDYIEDEILFDYDKFIQLVFKFHVEAIKKLLRGKKYILVQGFNPIFGYIDTSLLPKQMDNFVEWGKKNNTLHDMCIDTWLQSDKENYMMDKSWGLNRIRGIKHLAFAKPPVESKYLASCSHPSWEGHKLISEKLIPYIETKL